MPRPDTDCSLELHEADRLLDLLFFVFEHADTERDWFAMRAAVGSGLHAVQQVVGKASRKYDSGFPGNRPGMSAH